MRRPPSRRERATVSIDHGDFGQGLFDGGGDLCVFVVDDAGDFESGLGVEAFGRVVRRLGGESLEILSTVRAPVRSREGPARAWS